MLPIVERLLANNSVDRNQRGRLPRVIVLAPTRELAKQVRCSSSHRALHLASKAVEWRTCEAGVEEDS